jgi:hypothetical protein
MLIHKHIYYFLMEAPPAAKGQPQRKEKIRNLAWVPLDKAQTMSGYKDIRPILRRVRKHLSPI